MTLQQLMKSSKLIDLEKLKQAGLVWVKASGHEPISCVIEDGFVVLQFHDREGGVYQAKLAPLEIPEALAQGVRKGIFSSPCHLN